MMLLSFNEQWCLTMIYRVMSGIPFSASNRKNLSQLIVTCWILRQSAWRLRQKEKKQSRARCCMVHIIPSFPCLVFVIRGWPLKSWTAPHDGLCILPRYVLVWSVKELSSRILLFVVDNGASSCSSLMWRVEFSWYCSSVVWRTEWAERSWPFSYEAQKSFGVECNTHVKNGMIPLLIWYQEIHADAEA